jgi:hypothetical protein
MGSVRLTPLALPLRTGARAEFSFGLADGAAEIRRATFTLRHFREAAAEEATPLCTLAVAESGDPPPRTMQAGLDVVVAFDVPGDAPGTRMVSATPSYWEFEVVGETREGLYEERFLVPLYAAAERSSP